MGATIAGTGYEYEEVTYATGEVTMEDAFRFFPMLYSISTGETNGQHIRAFIENVLKTSFSSEAFNHKGGWNYGFSRLDITLDLAAGDGQRVTALSYSDTGEAVGINDNISITGCQRLPMDAADTLCGYPGFTNVEAYTAPYLGEKSTALDMFVHLIESGAIQGSTSKITDTSNTPRWLEVEFIQPLYGVGPGAAAEDGNDCGFFGPCSDGGGFGGGGISVFGFGFGFGR